MIRIAALLLLLLPGITQAGCRQALALGLDVSGSVDEIEYRLQLDGLAAALNAPAVRAVLLREADAPVRIAVYEWSGPSDLKIIQPWIALRDAGDLAVVTSALQSHQQRIKRATTAIGSALLAGFALLDGQDDCWQRTLDLSGDGISNTGPRPQDITAPRGITVNGLVIGSTNEGSGDGRVVNVDELSSYYRAYVIRGDGSFVEKALDFPDYAAAMERKFLRELQSIAIGNKAHRD